MRVVVLLLCLFLAAQTSALQWSFGTNVVTREAQLREAARAKARAKIKGHIIIKRHVVIKRHVIIKRHVTQEPKNH